MELVANACPSCGQEMAGRFCSHCGEKRVDHHDFTAKHFVEESVESFTHFDNKLLRSLRVLLKPGQLTLDFEQGRKVRFMKPVQLFIICNVIFFLFAGRTNVFAVQLGSFLKRPNLRAFLFNRVGISPDWPRIGDLFTEKMAAQSKAFIAVFIPFFALYAAAAFYRKRKPLGLHLVFATHYFTFILLCFTIFNALIWVPASLIFHRNSALFDRFAGYFNLAVIVGYFTLAARRYFKMRPWSALLSGLGAGTLFVVLLYLYRTVLFYNIVRTLH